MGDADIIPIGTRGAAGRGAGKKPSKAARDLLGKPKGAPSRGTPPSVTDGAEASVPQRGSEAEERGQRHLGGPNSGAQGADVPQSATDGLDGQEGEAAGEPSLTLAPEPGAQTGKHTPKHRGIPMSDIIHAVNHAAMEVFGDDWERKLAHFIAFTRRRITGDYTIDEYGFDAEITERFFLSATRPLAEKWFRIEVRGIENIPKEGGALLVSNHSGTVPVDAMMTMFEVHERTGRYLRPLGADLVFRLPFIGTLARRGGVTLACSEDAERMLRGGELVAVWPEGFKGIGKPFSERYKLQRFGRGGFVSAALHTGVPIIPVSVVGAEEIYPLVGNVPSLARLLGVPYIPITPFFPLLGPLGMIPLPSKWIIEFGEPIRTDHYDASAAEDPMTLFDVTDQVRETIQQTLYKLLMRRRSVFS
ncbi:lysophospholipid acyltransferase family protein [Nocardioides cavernaquae]|uniref:Acyltransferase family protein n=1 Tax=Nocardioides cavernaquae TaxID=2321396 RepID=A0A3A5HDW1_9ACTN|nr:lysophospholipid acyltransferase family protein [Nocardioides cavernaquae]RJS46107.1 acyltransferase family protein [Nocardioides cavernaquae]